MRIIQSMDERKFFNILIAIIFFGVGLFWLILIVTPAWVKVLINSEGGALLVPLKAMWKNVWSLVIMFILFLSAFYFWKQKEKEK